MYLKRVHFFIEEQRQPTDVVEIYTCSQKTDDTDDAVRSQMKAPHLCTLFAQLQATLQERFCRKTRTPVLVPEPMIPVPADTTDDATRSQMKLQEPFCRTTRTPVLIPAPAPAPAPEPVIQVPADTTDDDYDVL